MKPSVHMVQTTHVYKFLHSITTHPNYTFSGQNLPIALISCLQVNHAGFDLMRCLALVVSGHVRDMSYNNKNSHWCNYKLYQRLQIVIHFNQIVNHFFTKASLYL